MTKVLLVDDEIDILDTIQEYLEHHGYECFTASDGFEALRLLKDTDVDVIVSDLRMPTVNGLDLIQALRHSGNMTPIIWLSGHSTPEDFKAGWASGLYDCLEKPIDFKKLEQCIATALALGPDFSFERRLGNKTEPS